MSDEYGARVKIGGLWAHTTRSGLTFFTGDLGMFSQIQIWPNQKRAGKKDPDFNVFISEKQKREAVTSDNLRGDLSNSSSPKNTPNRSTSDESFNEIPF